MGEGLAKDHEMGIELRSPWRTDVQYVNAYEAIGADRYNQFIMSK